MVDKLPSPDAVGFVLGIVPEPRQSWWSNLKFDHVRICERYVLSDCKYEAVLSSTCPASDRERKAHL